MRVDLDVKELIKSVEFYINQEASEKNICDSSQIDEDGYVYSVFLAEDKLDIFDYLSVKKAKDLYNELFINDKTIMNALKSFAKKYGYIDATAEINETLTYRRWVTPILFLRKRRNEK